MNVAIPPRSRNHRLPAAPEAPTANAASSLLRPFAISSQNNRSTSRRNDGAPGDFIGPLPVNSFIHPAGLPIATPLDQVLQRPIESAQYTALIFGQHCRQAEIDRSMGAKGCALDNAVCEAFFASLKKERIRRRSWPTRRDAQTAIFTWMEAWYNRRRLHSTLGYLSPIEYETRTLGQPGAGLAASRLAPTSAMIKEKAA